MELAIKEEARRLGFSHVGICSVEPHEQTPFLREWLRRGFQGAMRYLENPKRLSPEACMDDACSIIVVGMNYFHPDAGDGAEAIISRYARGGDYHAVMEPLLRELAAFVAGLRPGARLRAYVDTGPVSEKHWAEKAGIGWIGKHTNVISRRGASWLFLGVLLTDLPLKPDSPATNHCGTCNRCITACPTRAIVAPYVLDARLCISYLTIELRGPIPRELRPLIGTRIFGCDDCQDVCPWNRFAFAGDPRLAPRPEMLSAGLRDYLRLTPAGFRARFAGTNILRAKYSGFIRNCLVAAGNSRRADLREEIERHTASDNEVIREHAVWALVQIDAGSRMQDA